MKKWHEDKESIVYTGKHFQNGEPINFRIAKVHGMRGLSPANGVYFTPLQVRKLATKMLELIGE